MTYKNPVFSLLVSLLLLAGCGGSGNPNDVPSAEPAGVREKTVGNFTVHYSAISTDQLTAEIAQAYDIVRSKNRAMLNVSVQQKPDNRSVTADVAVATSNLTGQVKNVAMREVKDGDAIYYIGVTPVANQETLIFNLSVTPESANGPIDVRFQHKFYTD